MELQRITTHPNPSARSEKWHVVDAEGERLGRLASKIAGLLQGKHRPDYSRHQLSEDFVIVVNAAKIGVSGAKMTQKVYYRHSGYLGGMRTRTLEEMLARFPARVIELAVKGMLPRNRLGRRMLRRLKVYAGPEHPHEAQVRIGMGKPKPQAPAAEPAPARRRRRAPAQAPEPPADAPEDHAEDLVEEQAAAVEAQEPAGDDAQTENADAADPEAPVGEDRPEETAVAEAESAPHEESGAQDEPEEPSPESADAAAEAESAPEEESGDQDEPEEPSPENADAAAESESGAEKESGAQDESEEPSPENADAAAQEKQAEGERK